MKRYLAKQASASNAEQLVMCGASHALPQHENYNEALNAGNVGHEVIKNVINRQFGAAMKMNDLYPGLTMKLAEIMEGTRDPKAEAAYVVNVKTRTSIFVGYDIGRKYAEALGRPLETYELGTSIDCFAEVDVPGGWIPWVRDWKFGIHSSWWQLFVQSMAILWHPEHAKGQTEVNAGFVHIENRAGEDDGSEGDNDVIFVSEDAANVYLTDLDDRAEEMVRAIDYAISLKEKLDAGANPTEIRTVEGKWCKYCSAFPHCPSKWKLAKSMLDLDPVAHVAALTPMQCAAAWIKLGEIDKNIIKKTKDAIKLRLEAEQDKSGGGFVIDGTNKMLRMTLMPGRQSLDRAALAALLRDYEVHEEDIAKLFKQGDDYPQVRQVNINGPSKKAKAG